MANEDVNRNLLLPRLLKRWSQKYPTTNNMDYSAYDSGKCSRRYFSESVTHLMAQWVDMEVEKSRIERLSVPDHPT